jgi:hypothetical protein
LISVSFSFASAVAISFLSANSFVLASDFLAAASVTAELKLPNISTAE